MQSKFYTPTIETLLFVVVFFVMIVTSAKAMTLSELEAMTTKTSTQKEAIPTVRYHAMRDTALAIGTQNGLLERSKAYQNVLEKHSGKLDRLYRFGPLYLKKGVLPPVIDEAQDAVVQDSPDTIRYADKIYRIQVKERFTTTVPTWRDYLYVGLNGQLVDSSVQQALVPHTSAEQELWKQYIREGWNAGVLQADEIYETNLARLERDYAGMIRFKILYAKAMVSMPVINTLHQATTGDANEMSVNDRVFRIMDYSGLRLDTKEWKPVVLPEAKND
jgi:defect-in-organelle-trafficking protein DotC